MLKININIVFVLSCAVAFIAGCGKREDVPAVQPPLQDSSQQIQALVVPNAQQGDAWIQWQAQQETLQKLPGKSYNLSDLAIEWVDIRTSPTDVQSYYKICLQGSAYLFKVGSSDLIPSYINGNAEKCSLLK